jgi:hypothetical protein
MQLQSTVARRSCVIRAVGRDEPASLVRVRHEPIRSARAAARGPVSAPRGGSALRRPAAAILSTLPPASRPGHDRGQGRAMPLPDLSPLFVPSVLGRCCRGVPRLRHRVCRQGRCGPRARRQPGADRATVGSTYTDRRRCRRPRRVGIGGHDPEPVQAGRRCRERVRRADRSHKDVPEPRHVAPADAYRRHRRRGRGIGNRRGDRDRCHASPERQHRPAFWQCRVAGPADSKTYPNPGAQARPDPDANTAAHLQDRAELRRIDRVERTSSLDCRRVHRIVQPRTRSRHQDRSDPERDGRRLPASDDRHFGDVLI